jgi:hypothetical protein
MSDETGAAKPKGRPSKAALVAEAVALLLDEKEMMGLKMPEIKAKIDFARGEIEKAEEWPDDIATRPIDPGHDIEPGVRQTIEDIPQCEHDYTKNVRVIPTVGSNYVCDRCWKCGAESNKR